MRSSNIPGSYIFLLFFLHFELYAIFIRFSSIIAQFPKNILTLITFHRTVLFSVPTRKNPALQDSPPAAGRSVNTATEWSFYMMIHTMPPRLSLTIFCMESWSFAWLSSVIWAILLRIPSSTSCSTDFPKIFVFQIPSEFFALSLI